MAVSSNNQNPKDMIRSFGVGNFKSFRDFQEVDLRQLNLIFGPNNHGKSSFTQALNLLFEILKRPKEDVTLLHGGYNRIANDSTKPILFSVAIDFQFSLPTESNIEPLDPDSIIATARNYTSTIKCEFQVTTNITHIRYTELNRKLDSYELSIGGTADFDDGEIIFPNSILSEIQINEDVFSISINDSSDIIDHFYKTIFPNSNTHNVRFTPITNKRVDKYGYDSLFDGIFVHSFNESEDYKAYKRTLKTAHSLIQGLHNCIIHNTAYQYNTENKEDTCGSSNTFKTLLDIDHHALPKTDLLDKLHTLDNKRFIKSINNILFDLNLKIEFTIVTISHPALPTSKVIRFKNTETDQMLHFEQLGSSIKSLLANIFVLITHQQHIVILEEPEKNLHPSLASRFGKVLVNTSDFKYYSDENDPIGHLRNITLVETHSEHIIKAIQLEVARYASTNGREGINRDTINILYIRKDEKSGSSTIRRIEIDEFGSFTEPWPDDFFIAGADLTLERLRLINRGL